MANRSTFSINIDDTQFTAFRNQWNQFQQIYAQHGQNWTANSTQSQLLHQNLLNFSNLFNMGLQNATTKASNFQNQINTASLSWKSMAVSSKLFSHHIENATFHLIKWSTLTSLFTGLVGAGGLWGISRLAQNAALSRQLVTGMGTTYGEYYSSVINFGRLGNIGGILGRFGERLHSIGAERQPLVSLGISDEETDPAKAFAKALPQIKKILEATPEQGWGAVARARGWDQLGIDIPFMKTLNTLSWEEVNQIEKNQVSGIESLKLTDDQLRKWTDFKTQLDSSYQEIQTALITGLTPLIPGLKQLSDSVVTIFKELSTDQDILDLSKKLGDSIKQFGDWLGSSAAQEKFKSWVAKIDKSKEDFNKLNDWFAKNVNILIYALTGGITGAAIGGLLAGPFGAFIAGLTGMGVGAIAGAYKNWLEGKGGGAIQQPPVILNSEEAKEYEKQGQKRFSLEKELSRSLSSAKNPIELSVMGTKSNKDPIGLASRYIDKNPTANHEELQSYLQGQGIDERTSAWCAAFVNSTLRRSGYRTTNSNLALSFRNWGQAANWPPKRNDVGVRQRGRPGSGLGHVGIATGRVDAQGNAEFIEANTGGDRGVHLKWEPPGSFQIRHGEPIVKQEEIPPRMMRKTEHSANIRKTFGHLHHSIYHDNPNVRKPHMNHPSDSASPAPPKVIVHNNSDANVDHAVTTPKHLEQWEGRDINQYLRERRAVGLPP